MLDNDPEQLTLNILTLRSFARAKEIYDNSKSRKDLPQSDMMDLVIEIDFEEAAKEPRE